ncbi:hypothetical protein [Azoarcus taiwanensis]|uniref:Uncharacterized protein n=1 Tax=Azoarcus taiwanensis TaxID=666964 RepID=A0A972F9W4_9RHOO|nr:hypothetical protein [Azoarcus taiwanensis]NMG05051.1 hypothetical protein [Azoarcus taiwanensis]
MLDRPTSERAKWCLTPFLLGLDTNIVTPSIRAIVSGINRIQPDVAAVTDIRAA